MGRPRKAGPAQKGEKGSLGIWREKAREEVRKELGWWELEFIGGKADVQDGKPVIGKRGKICSSGPAAVKEFFNQDAVGRRREEQGIGFMQDVTESRRRVFCTSRMSFLEEEVVGSPGSEQEQIKSVLGGNSGIGMQRLDFVRQIKQGIMEGQVGSGEIGNKGGRGSVEFFSDLRNGIASWDASARLVFLQGGEGDSNFIGKLPHTHAPVHPFPFQCGRKNFLHRQKDHLLVFSIRRRNLSVNTR